MSSKAKSKNGGKRKATETYESDGFISNDDGNAPKSKKTKTAVKGKSGADPTWDLESNKAGVKKATIQEFKGNTYINIREYYEKDGEHLPGKKGIMLSLSAYTSLVKAIPAINKKLKESDNEIDVGGAADEEDEAEEEEEEEAKNKVVANKAAAKPAKKSKKANIETTSEEPEEEHEDHDDDDD